MIQSLHRGIQTLEILSDHDSMSVTEIAKELGVDKSTASRILDTLRECDMVQLVNSTRKYRLGFGILHLSESLKKNLNIIDIARPVLKEVSNEINQSVHLCAFNKNMVYVIDQVVSTQSYSLNASVGMVEPMHASSVGKCILAYRRPDMINDLIDDYEYVQYTNNTIMDKRNLLKELEKIKEQGYAIDDRELSEGVLCVAAPIFDYKKHVKYAIGISGPSNLMTQERVDYFRKKLIQAATKIGREVGYRCK